MVATEILAAGATGAIVNEALDRTKQQDERIVSLLENILAGIRVLQSYSEREREGSKTVVELFTTYSAGVAGISSTSIFTPQSPFLCEYFILAGYPANNQALIAALSFGTFVRKFPIPSVVDPGSATSRSSGVIRYDLPFYINSQVRFADVTPLFPQFDAYAYLVGSYDTQGTLDKQHPLGGYR